MADELAELTFLWDGTAMDWVLVLVRDDNTKSDLTTSHIYNTRTREIIVIENESIAREVRDRMIAAGVRILDKFPRGDPIL